MIHVLQDWTAIGGVGPGEVAQTGGSVLNLSGYQDVTFFLDVSCRSDVTLHYDTALPDDPWTFKSMANVVITLPTFVRTEVRLATADPPLSGLVRWRIVSAVAGGVSWNLAFRIECLPKRLRRDRSRW